MLYGFKLTNIIIIVGFQGKLINIHTVYTPNHIICIHNNKFHLYNTRKICNKV